MIGHRNGYLGLGMQKPGAVGSTLTCMVDGRYERAFKSIGNMQSIIHDTLESAKQELGFKSMDTSNLESRILSAANRESPLPLLNPLAEGGEQPKSAGKVRSQRKRRRSTIGVQAVVDLEKSETEGTVKKQQDPMANDTVVTVFDGIPPVDDKQLPTRRRKRDSIKENKKPVDWSDANPEERYKKIQSLYGDMQQVNESNLKLHASIKHRENQITSLGRDNTMLWSMATHIGSAIHLALDKENSSAQEASTPVPLAMGKTRTPPLPRKYRDDQEELEDLFSPGTHEFFASCHMFMTPPSKPEAPKKEMSPVKRVADVAKTPAKIHFPPYKSSPLRQEDFAKDDSTMGKQDSFTFQ